MVDEGLPPGSAHQLLLLVTPRPWLPLDRITDEALRQHGAEVEARGITALAIRAPLSRVEALAQEVPGIGFVELAVAPEPDVGSHQTQGVGITGASQFHCRGVTGAGIHVALVDVGFDRWSESVSRGELPRTQGKPSSTSTYHGTACAEVVADMAPGVTIHPLQASTRAHLESWVRNVMPGSGVTIVSRSLGSNGGGFGGKDSAWCTVAKSIANSGGILVNSAGNYGGGKFYFGRYSDSDGDGWHQFSGTGEFNRFTYSGSGGIKIQLDWDDYPASAQNLDLYLYRESGGKWSLYKSSKNSQSGSQEPREYLSTSSAPKGTYGVAIRGTKVSASNMPMRVFLYSGGNLKYFQSAMSINTISACPDTLTVGAINHAQYTTGPPKSYSSRGPTWDSRTKPDIAGPTDVVTLPKSAFSGTSAATPHVAGSVALYMQALRVNAQKAAQLLLKDAIGMGGIVPNNDYGRGRLTLDPKHAGWQCALGQTGSCTTRCGSEGKRTCASGCLWGSCRPPAEVCNGKDDDCDSKADNGFVCRKGTGRACTTACGGPGRQECGASCTWGICSGIHRETCNGKDDDCDGKVDEDGVCDVADAGPSTPEAGAQGGDGTPPTDEESGCSCNAGNRSTPADGRSAGATILLLLTLFFLKKQIKSNR